MLTRAAKQTKATRMLTTKASGRTTRTLNQQATVSITNRAIKFMAQILPMLQVMLTLMTMTHMRIMARTYRTNLLG